MMAETPRLTRTRSFRDHATGERLPVAVITASSRVPSMTTGAAAHPGRHTLARLGNL